MTDEQTLISDKKLNNLQKVFYSEFCLAFPDLKDKIEFTDGIIENENFCFNIKSPSDVFGSISFDIDDTEITVFTEFDHRHFPAYMYENKKEFKMVEKLTSDAVIDNVKDYFTGNIIVELHLQGDKIVKTKQYLKSDSAKVISTAIYADKNYILGNIITQLRKLIGLKSNKKNISVKRLNWFGEIE
jgi:hypothetical protein